MKYELNSDVQKESITSTMVTTIGENLDKYMIQRFNVTFTKPIFTTKLEINK